MSERMEPVTPAQVAQAYQDMAQSHSGRIVIADLMRRFGHTRAPMFRIGDTRPEDVVYREGQRSVLVHMGRLLDANIAEMEDHGYDGL